MPEPDDKLSRLESYQDLPGSLRNAVRLHLVHGLPVPEAMRLAGHTRNLRRDWSREQVQQVLAEYGNPDAAEDWISRLAAVKTPRRASPDHRAREAHAGI